ncbi:MAG: hypothetical protein KJ065_21390 [Anaerolineae bacterium]|nr:hypothetical protein [Anaerolineae bacterium]
MSVTMKVIEDGRILQVITADPWTLEDLTSAMHAITTTGSYTLAPRHTLIDVSRTQRLPPGILRARVHPDLVRLNTGYIVIVGANAIVRTMANALAMMAQTTRIQHFNTMQDALDFLHQVIEAERAIIA